MRYYRIGLSPDYFKKKGRYGNVTQSKSLNRYDLKDGWEFEGRNFQDLKFNWDSDNDTQKVLADYQINVPGFRLISEKMKDVLAKYNFEKRVKFIPVEVIKDAKIHKYFILHFLKIDDVIDEKNSYRRNAEISLSKNKIDGLDLFSIDEGYNWSFYTCEIIKRDLEKSEITGLGYNEVEVF